MNPVLSLLRAAPLAFLLLVTGAAAQRIAFINPDGQLVTVAPDGTDSRTLTPEGRRYQFPAWSPAGNDVAVIGASAEGSGVFTVEDRADAEVQTLYENPAIYLYWSPDGEKVGFLAQGEGGLELQVASTGRNDAQDTQKVASGTPLYWQWSRDSDGLLVHTGVLDSGELALYSLTGPTGDPLATPGLFNAPGLSASGDYLAYAELSGGATRTVLAGSTPENAEVRRELPYEGFSVLSWSPAADQLAVMNPPVATGLPYGPIRLLDAKTGDLTPLVETTVIAFFWSPDGKYIAYIAPLRRNDGDVTDIGTPSAVKVGVRVAQDIPLLELRVVDVETGEDRLLSAFTPTPLFIDQFLPFFDQYALSHSVWSPDSTALVLPMSSEGGSKIVVVPLTGEPAVLADGEMPFWSR